MEENYGFYALLDRMIYINRWALMRNSRYENIKEHSFDVAVIAQSLALIHNNLVDEGKTAVRVDPLLIATYGLYHDCTEIITCRNSICHGCLLRTTVKKGSLPRGSLRLPIR